MLLSNFIYYLCNVILFKMIKIEQFNGAKKGKFIAYINSKKAGLLEYIWNERQSFSITHTEVFPEFKGMGIGKVLLEKAVEYAREEIVKIIPICSFAQSQFSKNDKIKDVLE